MFNTNKVLSALLCLCIAGLAARAQYNSRNLRMETEQNARFYLYKNLALYPVYAQEAFKQAHKQVGNYTSLTEALAKKQVKITEMENGEAVNNLTIQNNSNDTVIILGGEVVKGGKQDRLVAQDVILPPKSKKINLDVYCVEHGRWTYSGNGGSVTVSGFNACSPVVGTEVRKAAVVTKQQTEVWDKVADVTEKNNSTSSTGTYTAMEKSDDLVKQLNAYKAYFETVLKGKTDVIGFVAVSGNKILGCDLFATHNLFEKQLKSLLSSYSTEAITNGSKPSAGYAQVKKYLDDLLADESQQEKKIEKKGNYLKVKDSKLHIAVY